MSTNNIILICLSTAAFLVIDTLLLDFFGVRIAISISIILLHLAFILVAISPIGASILRVIFGCRKVRTKRDKEYLLPLLEEVCLMATLEDEDENVDIGIYISEDMAVNAFSVGENSIVVTRGAMELLDKKQLKGMIAHELGHIVHGDTIIPLILIIGSVWCFPILLLIRAVKIFFQLEHYEEQQEKKSILATIVLGILNIFIFLITLPFQVIMTLNGRYNEYNADSYAEDICCGKGLISALYDVRSINGFKRLSPLETLKEVHPDIDKRIERLENM